MRYFRLKMIGLMAGLTFTLVYASLRQYPFGFDVALGASFTVLVFGNAIRRRGFGLFSGEEAKPVTEILLVHAASLAVLVIIVRMGMYLTPHLPDWLSTQVGADNQGRVGPTGFQILQSIAIFLLGFFEVRVLTAKKVAEDSEEKARGSLWSKPDLEAERMNGLRLR
jgi:hypothetical protein